MAAIKRPFSLRTIGGCRAWDGRRGPAGILDFTVGGEKYGVVEYAPPAAPLPPSPLHGRRRVMPTD